MKSQRRFVSIPVAPQAQVRRIKNRIQVDHRSIQHNNNTEYAVQSIQYYQLLLSKHGELTARRSDQIPSFQSFQTGVIILMKPSFSLIATSVISMSLRQKTALAVKQNAKIGPVPVLPQVYLFVLAPRLTAFSLLFPSSECRGVPRTMRTRPRLGFCLLQSTH